MLVLLRWAWAVLSGFPNWKWAPYLTGAPSLPPVPHPAPCLPLPPRSPVALTSSWCGMQP